MSRKSKKLKKPKLREVKVLSANEIENYTRIKFNVDDNGFWLWFFSKCPWGETNLLSFNDNDNIYIISNKFKEYYYLLKKEFLPDVNDMSCIEIKNDL